MNNNKGFTMIELIAVMIIISVITVFIVPKIVDLESSTERKLVGVVISELNAREQLAFLDYKLGFEYVPITTSDLAGVSLSDDELSLVFDGGGTHPVHRVPYTAGVDVPGKWYEGEESVGDVCPDGYHLDKNGNCKKDKKPKK